MAKESEIKAGEFCLKCDARLEKHDWPDDRPGTHTCPKCGNHFRVRRLYKVIEA